MWFYPKILPALYHTVHVTYLSLQYDKSKTIFKDVSWPSTDNLDAASKAGWDDNDPAIDLYAWFGKDPSYYGTVGLAWTGGACSPYVKTSFNEWRKTPAETAGVKISDFRTLVVFKKIFSLDVIKITTYVQLSF